MNRDETVELFLKGREAWNAWAQARLAERKAMEADGRWSAEEQPWGTLEAKNNETRAWMQSAAADFSRCLFLVRGAEGTKETAGEDKESSKSAAPPVKSIQLEAEKVDFEGFIFPGPATFDRATFSGYTWFDSATFSGYTSFDRATFKGRASFEEAAFTGPASFDRAAFKGNAWFEKAAFTGPAWFKSVTFTGYASFEKAAFTGYARFEGAIFTGYARFETAKFKRDASFASAAFSGAASFKSAVFFGDAWFRSATFAVDAVFESTAFTGHASFGRANFSGIGDFGRAAFSRDADFRSVAFSRDAIFRGTTFSGEALFWSAQFSGEAYFGGTAFLGDAFFRGQSFTHDVFFNEARFGPKGTADFGLATFERVVKFDGAAFEGKADFNAAWGKRTFSMAGARFEGVPDFIQAHFEEAPRLDNVKVKGRKIAAEDNRRDMPARWRALKRLAIEACDQDREHAFFAGEVRAARLAGDWPLPFVPPQWEGLPRWLGWINWVPFVFWRPEVWAGFFRFWAGWAYEIFSDFGRSLLRPLLFWLLVMSVATVYFLGECVRPPGLAGSGVAGAAQAYADLAWDALRDPPRCFAGERRELAAGQKTDAGGKAGEEKKSQVTFSGLTATAAESTNALKEAINLSWHNAFIVLDGGADSAHRTYGCLYGVERYGGNPVTFVPSSVARASGAQKLLSALFIFLFGLALRNMLKMK